MSYEVTTFCEFFYSVFILKVLAALGLAKLDTFKLFLKTISNQWYCESLLILALEIKFLSPSPLLLIHQCFAYPLHFLGIVPSFVPKPFCDSSSINRKLWCNSSHTMLFWYLAIVQIENCPESFSLKLGLVSKLTPHFNFRLDRCRVLPLFLSCYHHLKLFDSFFMLLLFAPPHEVFDELAHLWFDRERIWTPWVMFVKRICMWTEAHHFDWTRTALILNVMCLCVS